MNPHQLPPYLPQPFHQVEASSVVPFQENAEHLPLSLDPTLKMLNSTLDKLGTTIAKAHGLFVWMIRDHCRTKNYGVLSMRRESNHRHVRSPTGGNLSWPPTTVVNPPARPTFPLTYDELKQATSETCSSICQYFGIDFEPNADVETKQSLIEYFLTHMSHV